MKADSRFGGDLNARLVACWPVMPDERAQRRHTTARWSAWPRRSPHGEPRQLAGRPLNQPIQSVQSCEEQPDSVICSEEFSKSVDF